MLLRSFELLAQRLYYAYNSEVAYDLCYVGETRVGNRSAYQGSPWKIG